MYDKLLHFSYHVFVTEVYNISNKRCKNKSTINILLIIHFILDKNDQAGEPEHISFNFELLII